MRFARLLGGAGTYNGGMGLSESGSTRAWRRLRAAVLARDKGRCHYCGGLGADSADHVMPRARGGLDEMGNLVAAHLRCNKAKGDRVPDQPNPSRSW